jgi:hypothetical protein
VIKIRYADLPGGLHVRVAASGNDTIIYLLPGLTTMQRRAALRRARSSARMGHGPGLPSAGVAGAVVADGVRTTLRNVAGAMRIHPGIFFPPIVIISFAAVAYILLVSVTAQVHVPQESGPASGIPQAVAPPPGSAPQAAVPRPTGSAPRRSAKPRPTSPARGHHPGRPEPSASPRPSGPAPTTEPSPSPTPVQPVPSASPSPRTDPDPGGIVATSGSTGSGLCLDVGPLGACLSMSAR